MKFTEYRIVLNATGKRLTIPKQKRLKRYRLSNGIRWKSKLSAEWANGSEEMRSIRNKLSEKDFN